MNAPVELWRVAQCLGEVLPEVVFVGGMIRELLITDPAAGPARPTQDVDCIVNVASHLDYVRLSGRLRALGFVECRDEDAPICRWIVQQIRVDVLPIDPAVFGFTNVWYPSAIQYAVRVQGPNCAIRIVDAVHFCATKIEAFLARGDGDFYQQDMEDIIAIIDGRAEIVEEIGRAPAEVRDFIVKQFDEWLGDEQFLDALSGNLRGDPASQARLPVLLSRLREMAELLARTVPASERSLQRPAVLLHEPRPTPVRLESRAIRAESSPDGWVSLRSTNLNRAKHDQTTGVLAIEFQNGGIYEYAGVPRNIFVGLLNAASHGRYFHQWIKDRYFPRRLK
jgi:hypothetical protein